MPAVRAPYFYPARDGGNHQQTRTNKYRRLPAVRAPYFYPARDGGNHQQTRTMNIADMQHDEPRIKTPPRTEADSRTRQTTQKRGHGQWERREGSTTTNTSGPPAERTTPRRTHGAKDQPEPPGEKQTMRTTRGSTMQPELTNRPTMTPFMPMPPTKKQVNT